MFITLVLAEENQGIDFQVDYDPSIPMIYFDRDLLVQANFKYYP